MLFVIPSWGDLLGYPTLGKYVNHYVSKIETDLVIFLAGLESSIMIEQKQGLEPQFRTLHFIFGLGIYYSKFELQSGRYIVDNRELTGLILSDFVYDHLATSRNITLQNDRDVVIAEKVIKIPIDLSNKTTTKITFIKGALMRNLFIPHKDVFLDFMDLIKKPDSYNPENGHIFLSTHWSDYNKILISTEMKGNVKLQFMNSTAGIEEIVIGADKVINKIFTLSERKEIDKRISFLKDVYSNLSYDPMYLFSIIDKASNKLIAKRQFPSAAGDALSSEKGRKESILISAGDRIESVVKWPEEFKRNTKKDLELSAVYKEFKENPPIIRSESSSKDQIMDLTEELETKVKRQEFELRTLKRPSVNTKPLPSAPEDDIISILSYLKRIIDQDYEIIAIGKAFENARDNLRKIILQSKFMWEMGKYINMFQREKPNIGLNKKEKEELLEKVDIWIKKAEKKKDRFLKRKS
ncbi:MAG: hypothetical protein EU539_03130 [Promethearchaeota archaeon]|nr:MAG: hypothetical protein EU539_03130 [Candidatus Lokiarchaeota archaeon]